MKVLPNVEVNDRELMARLASGEVSLLGELYLRHGQLVRRRLAYFVSDISVHEIDDLCQDVFIAVHKAAPGYKENGKLTSWLSGIAIKKARAFRRKTFLRRKLLGKYKEERKAISAPSVVLVDSQRIVRDEFERALESLSPSYREVILLSAAEEMSGEEIAEVLGIGIGAVWTKLHRARRAMRVAMKDGSVKGLKEE